MQAFPRCLMPALLLVSCSPAPEEVAAHTAHCGVTVVGPLLMRLSTYRRSIHGDQLWLVQACQSQGYCEPLVTFRLATGPVYSIDDQGALVIELLGGRVVGVHRRELSSQFGRDARPVVVRTLMGRRTQEELNRFRARMGLPPGNYSRDLCDRAIDPRPSFAAP